MKIRTAGAWATVALGGVLALVFLLFRSAGVEAVYPVERAASEFSRRIWTRVVGVVKGAESRAENVRLRRELAAYSLLRGEMDRLEAENARLRDALGYARRSPVTWLPACVLSFEGGAAAAHKSIRVGKGSLDDVAGPVGIVSVISEQAKTGFLNVLYLTAIISLNLGIINLLPLPALDGGRLVFLLINLITGKKVSTKVEGTIHGIGMILLLALMAFILVKDVLRLIG